nr:S-locus-specific glycoprotein S13 isoform X2 [Oryza sativa Japonica Group]
MREMSTLSHQHHHVLVLQLILLLPFLHLVVPGTPAAARKFSDVLASGRNVSDGDVLVSPGGSFTLGFFSPAATRRRYLGIWFSVSPDAAVHWVANRDHALNDTSGALMLTDAGVLLLLDGSGKVVWSSSATALPSATTSAAARLLDSGNLVVQGQGSGTALWQSFDYPTNTLLPGMKIGKNRWTGAEWYLLSWRSPADPSPGSYRYVTDGDEALPENVVLDGNGTEVYRTGVWNGRRFNGVPEMASFADMFSFQLTVSPGEVTYGYVAKAGAPFSRVVVTDDGVVRRLVWDAATRAWKTFFQAPGDSCDSYAKCGAFGLCDSNAGATSICRCVKGFSPASPAEWSMREYSGGCRRDVALDCGTDGFAVLRGVKLPDTRNASVDMGVKLDECRARCVANCSCVAYAAADLSGGGCIMWTKPFVDLRFIDNGQDIYQRLAKSEIGRPPHWKLPVVITVAVVLVIIVVFVLVWAVKRKPREGGIRRSVSPGITSIDRVTLQNATENFAKEKLIGEGNYGRVYKGILPAESTITGSRQENEIVAVKLLQPSGTGTFVAELEAMFNAIHVNLVRLLAFCSDNDDRHTGEKFRALVYEYMPNNSLHHYIFGGLPVILEGIKTRENKD